MSTLQTPQVPSHEQGRDRRQTGPSQRAAGPASAPARSGVGQVVLVDHSSAGGVPPPTSREGNPSRAHHGGLDINDALALPTGHRTGPVVPGP
eukprot:9230047-Alexandrium_andersonii.AAC.1